jgi:hypothetical protein
MRIEAPVAFVTGANRSLDLVFVKELLGRGVKKIYGGIAIQRASNYRRNIGQVSCRHERRMG